MTHTPIEELERLVTDALAAAGAAPETGRQIASYLVRAEAEGNAVCGLHYAFVFVEQLQHGRIDGSVRPVVTRPKPAIVAVDACNGFAHTAIAAGLPVLISAARDQGIAAMAVTRSTNALALSHIVAPLAEQGLLALSYANAPAAMVPPGGKVKLVGTNPLAMAVPGRASPLIVLDQSTSAVTKTEIIRRRDRGEAIPEGWAVDEHGQPTTNAQAALDGSLAPAGGHKGFGIALMVEVLAAALTGAVLSKDASPFFGAEGGPSGTGQFIIAVSPESVSGDALARFEALVAAISDQSGARLPGAARADRLARATANGIQISPEVLASLAALGNAS